MESNLDNNFYPFAVPAVLPVGSHTRGGVSFYARFIMGKDPAFLFYPNDYIGGTMGMTFEEKGAYMELLMMQFNRGHMTSHMIGQTVGQLWDKIKVKFVQDENGLWYNERLESEKNKRKAYVNSRKNNLKGVNQHTKKRGRKTKHTNGQLTSRMENENRDRNKDTNTNRNKCIHFESFWKKYPIKKDKKKCMDKWKRRNLDEKFDQIMDGLQNLINNDSGWLDGYIPNALTFINGDKWEDEPKTIVKNNKPKSRQPRIAVDPEQEQLEWEKQIRLKKMQNPTI